MGLIAWFKEKMKMLFKTDAEKAFGVETYLSPEMDAVTPFVGVWIEIKSSTGLRLSKSLTHTPFKNYG